MAHAVAVQAPSPRARITGIDSAAAKSPGVSCHHPSRQCAEAVSGHERFRQRTKLGESRRLFADNRIYYAGQYVARGGGGNVAAGAAAANLVKVDADEKEPALTLEERQSASSPATISRRTKYKRGNVTSALQAAAQGVRCTYNTPVEHHNPMEPSASWPFGRVTASPYTKPRNG